MTTVLKLLYFLKLQLLKLAAPAYIKFQGALIYKLSMFTIGFSKRKYEIAKTEEFVKAFPAKTFTQINNSYVFEVIQLAILLRVC